MKNISVSRHASRFICLRGGKYLVKTSPIIIFIRSYFGRTHDSLPCFSCPTRFVNANSRLFHTMLARDLISSLVILASLKSRRNDRFPSREGKLCGPSGLKITDAR